MGKIFKESEKCFSEIGGKSETGGKCIVASGGIDAPDVDSAFDLLLTQLLYGAVLGITSSILQVLSNRNRKLEISRAPTKAKSREPAYSWVYVLCGRYSFTMLQYSSFSCCTKITDMLV